MSAISLINSGVAWFVAAAVLAFLFSFSSSFGCLFNLFLKSKLQQSSKPLSIHS